jgi:hypothetical protein
MQLKYIGPADLRLVSTEAWEAEGIKDQESVSWRKGQTSEVSKEAGQLLLDREPNEWKEELTS